MITAEAVKRFAMAQGADIVGIGSVDRWEGAPIQMDPRQIMPEAKSVIGMAFRFMRGSLRGIEEGTFFSNYSSMGYGGLTHLYIPMVVINLAKFLEDQGYEAMPIGALSPWRAIDNEGKTKPFAKPVAPGRAVPDVMVHQRIAGYLCGLGEIGWSKVFLTKRFGPRQRLGIVLTEAELEPDPVMKPGTLCNRCMACVKDCPTGAIKRTESVKVKLGGYDVEWNDLDCKRCAIGLRGGVPVEDEEHAKYLDNPSMMGMKVGRGPHTPWYHKPQTVFETGQAICGGRGCLRACMMTMEQRGVLDNKFHTKFRRRAPWTVNWEESGPAGTNPTA